MSFRPRQGGQAESVARQKQPCVIPTSLYKSPQDEPNILRTQVWLHVYGRDNLNVAPEDHAVLLTEAPLNPYKNRRQCAETFFENFGVPAMFCAPQVKRGMQDCLRH